MKWIKLFEGFNNKEKIDYANEIIFLWAINKYLEDDEAGNPYNPYHESSFCRKFVVGLLLLKGIDLDGYWDKEDKKIYDPYHRAVDISTKKTGRPGERRIYT